MAIPAGEAQPPKDGYVSTAEVRAAAERAASAKELPPLAHGVWMGGVFVLPYQYGGPYDKDAGGQYNVAPRQWVAQSFFASNPDAYDFIVVFTGFDFDSGSWLAFYNSIRNDVAGIGLDLLDTSDAFGSQRLQGYIDLKRLSAYLRQDGGLDQDRILLTLNHEIGHRWLAHCRYRDPQGTDNAALLGIEGTHWSYLLDSGASYMYGSDWRDNGDGTFTATAVLQRYGPLDLYLMGLAPASEVSAFFLLANGSVSAAQPPSQGDVVQAQKETVNLDQIVAAEGARQPGYLTSPHEFKVAVIYLLDPSTPAVDPQDLERLEAIRVLWQGSFFQKTGGRGLVEPGNHSVPPGPGTSCDVPMAVSWLAGQVKPGGTWADSEATPVRDTAAAVEALDGYTAWQALVSNGLLALADAQADSTELLAQKGEILASHGSPAAAAVVGQIETLGSPGAGWSSFSRYSGDCVTTARVLRALAAAGSAEPVQQGWTWLQGLQNADGGWGWRPGAPSESYPTLEVLLAAKATVADFSIQPFFSTGVNWLAGRTVDGGTGEPYPDVPQTAMFLQILHESPAYAAQAAAATSFLARHQSADGSWEQSVYKTALAITSLEHTAQPDPYVLTSEVYSEPAAPYVGETLALHAAVHDRGMNLPEGVAYEWQILDQEGTEVASLPGVLPAIPDGSSFGVAQSWPSPAPEGAYSLKFVIDPEALFDDADRSNNAASIPLVIAGHPAGVDLRLRDGLVSAIPQTLTQVPQAVTVSGTVENLGTSLAAGAVIAVFDGTGSAPLSSATVSVPAQGQAAFEIGITLTEPRAYDLRIVADPDNLLADVNRINNTVHKAISLTNVEDLEVVAESFTITTAGGGTPTVGDAVTLAATVRNRGSVVEPTVQVGFSYTVGAPPAEYSIHLGTLDAPLAPGESRIAQATWRPNQPGSPATVSAVADPNGIVSHDVNLANNRADKTLVILASDKPNLVALPSGIAVTPVHPLQGQNAHVASTVTNVGSNPAGGFALDLYLGEPLTGTSLAHLDVPALAAGATATVEADWLVEGTADRLIYVVADAAGVVEEFNEDDNTAFVIMDVQSLADLLVTAGSVDVTPPFPHVGQAVRFDVTVLNAGDQSAVNVPVVLKDAQGATLASQTLASVAPRSSAMATLDWAGASAGGEVRLAVVINPEHAIPELSYDNNTASLALPVQNADIYVSERYFSPNGDGVKDTTTVYFRQGQGAVSVIDARQATVRTLSIPSGSLSVVWDGKDDQGSVVGDGAYQLQVGSVSAGVVVDNNRTTISGDPSTRLLRMEVVGSDSDEELVAEAMSPNPGEYFLVGRRTIGGNTIRVLQRCDPGGTADIGDFPPNTDLIAGSMDGRVFLAGGDDDTILTYPGPVTKPCNVPGNLMRGDSLSLTPDGKWAIAVGQDGSVVVIRAADPSQTFSFSFGGSGDFLYGRAQIVTSVDSQEAIIVYSVDSNDDQPVELFYRRVTLTDPPQATAVSTLNWFLESWDCGVDWRAAADFKRRTLTILQVFAGCRSQIGTESQQGKVGEFRLQDGAILSEDTMPGSYSLENSLSRNGLVVGTCGWDNEARTLTLRDWQRKASYSHGTFADCYSEWSTLDMALSGELSGTAPEQFIPYLTPADNLLLDLKPRVLFGNAGIQLTVTVCDRDLDHYTIEYLKDEQGSSYQPIGLASREPRYNENWGTWLPPAKGRYTVRLSAGDFAGNHRSVSKSVTWNGENDIANLALDSRYITPANSQGRSELVFRFVVLRPCNLLFRILDSSGNLIRLLPVARDQLGPTFSTWDGRDDAGNLVPDGPYSLEYLGATWPFAVDDTPPSVVLEIGDNGAVDNGLSGQDAKDLYVNEVNAAVSDANLDEWSYQVRPAGGSEEDWRTLETRRNNLLSPDGQPLVIGAWPMDVLAGHELRLVATDLAGNQVKVQRFHRQEEIAFADSEPACRLTQPPACVYPDRPSIEEVGDGGGLLSAGSPAKLWPSYNTLLIQQSVWDFDRVALKLDYRTPGGAWQEGTLVVKGGSSPVYRSLDGFVGGLLPLYWDHPNLPQQNYEVRLRVNKPSGEIVTSPIRLFVPEFSLGFEFLNVVDALGGHYKVTNWSTKPLTLEGVSVRERQDKLDPALCLPRSFVIERPGLWDTTSDALPSGTSCVITTGCDAFGDSHVSKLPLVAWVTAHDDAQKLYVSAECEFVPHTNRYSVLTTSQAGSPPSCPPAPTAPAGATSDDPCDEETLYQRHTSGGIVPFSVSLPPEPAGSSVLAYDFLLDGAVAFSITGPQSDTPYSGQLDLSSKPEGVCHLTERYRYESGQEGLLGRCTQTWSLVIDRTPPQVSITSPTGGASICRSAGVQTVLFSASDNSRVRAGYLQIDGNALGEVDTESGQARFSPAALVPGSHTLTVIVTDPAAWAACNSVQITIVDGNVHISDLNALPKLFSPVNTLGRPAVSGVTFLTAPQAAFELSVVNQSGIAIAAVSGSADSSGHAQAAWNGRDTLGALAPDGFYGLRATVHPCGEDLVEELQKAIELDTSPPSVSVADPSPGLEAGAALEVMGSSTDENFAMREIQVRSALDCETCWVTVATGNRPAPGPSSPLGTWHTGEAAPGAYLVRVRAEDGPGNETVTSSIPITLREKRFIESFAVNPPVFSPNGDSKRDLLGVHFELVQTATTTLLVADGLGNTIKTLLDHAALSVQAGGYDYAWDGTGDVGGAAADGVYTVKLRAEDTAQPPVLNPEEESLVAVLDVTQPLLDITSIAEGGLYGQPLDVSATLTDANPDTHAIALTGPGGITQVLRQGSGGLADEYVATLQNLPDGAYQITFDATDAAENVAGQLVRAFTLDSSRPVAQIDNPPRDAFVRVPSITLAGSISTPHLQSYAWQYAEGVQPAESDFHEIASGTSMPEGGHIEYPWDISVLQDGSYTLRLLVSDQMGHAQEGRCLFTVDRTAPEAAITSPAQGQVLTAPTDVVGSALDTNLKGWTLDVVPSGGAPYQPPLAQGTAAVDGAALARWILLPPEGEYALRLTVEDKAGNTNQATVTVQVGSSAISPPTNLTAAVQDHTDVLLSWQPGPGTSPSGYNVYRDAQRLNASPVPAVSYTDQDVPQGSHTFTVRALSSGGLESGDSNAVAVAVSTNAPVALISAPSQGAYVSGAVAVRGTAFCETGFKEYRLAVRPAPSGSWTAVSQSTAPVVAGLLGIWDSQSASWPEGSYELKLEAEDLQGHAASVSVAVTLDNTPPSPAPILDEATATPSGSSHVHVAWHSENPPPDLAGYYLYRDGALANAPGPVIGPQKPYLLTGTAYEDLDVPDGVHAYSVTGADLADNESPVSNALSVVIDVRRPQAIITSPADNARIQGPTSIVAQCPDTDVVSVAFQVKLVADSSWTDLGAPVTQRPYTVIFVPPQEGTYQLHAVASDAVGPDLSPAAITVTVADLPPGAPPALVARVDGGDVILTWPASPDPFADLSGYKVYRDGACLTQVALPENVLTYVDAALADGHYHFTLRALDDAGQESPDSPEADAYVYTPRMAYLDPIRTEATTDIDGSLLIPMDRVELQKRDGSGAYQTVQTQNPVDIDGACSFQQVELFEGLNAFRLVGADADGNRSKPSNTLVLVRHEPPQTPANLAASVAGSDVTLSWETPPDMDSSGFTVYKNGAIVNEITSSMAYDPNTQQLSASSGTPPEIALAVDGNPDTGWAPSSVPQNAFQAFWQWTWNDDRPLSKVALSWDPGLVPRYFDLDVQAQGEWIWWATCPTPAPQMELTLNLTGTGIRIRPGPGCSYWSGCAPQLNEVQVTTLQRTMASPYLDPGLPQGAFAYQVRQINRWGQSSDWTWTCAYVGIPEPAPPSGLTAMASANCAEILLSWLAPDPPDPGLQGYLIYRRQTPGDPFAELCSLPPSVQMIPDGGLATGSSYVYQVRAFVDVGGVLILTGPSNEASASPACPNPPLPLINAPTTAGNPVNWPTTTTTIGGRALRGSTVHLLQNGADVGAAPVTDLPALEMRDYSGGAIGISEDGGVIVYETHDAASGYLSVDVLDVRAPAVTRLAAADSSSESPSVSRDGAFVAFVSDRAGTGGAEVYKFERATGSETQLTSEGVTNSYSAFSPDGHLLAFISYGGFSLKLIDLQDGTTQTLYVSGGPALRVPAFSPNGAWIAIGAGPELVLVNPGTGETRQVAGEGEVSFTSRPFTPDGGQVIYSRIASTRSLWKYDLPSGVNAAIGAGDGEMAAVCTGQDAYAYLARAPSGEVTLRERSFSGGTERILAPGLSISALPGGGSSSQFSLNGTASGALLVPQNETLVEYDHGRGNFSFPGRSLQAGANAFVARQVVPEASSDSLPIQVNANPAAFPDAKVEGVTSYPRYPLSGDSVLITGAVSNAGQAPLSGCRVLLQRLTPEGGSDVVLEQVIALSPGETSLLRYTWNTSGLDGDFTWTLRADPLDSVPELEEANNIAQTVVPVRQAPGTEARTSTDQASYLPGGTVTIQDTLFSNDAPKDFTLTTLVEDSSGHLVAVADSRSFPGFGPGSAQFSVAWPVGSTYPGCYRVHLRATSGGALKAEAFSPFVLAPQVLLVGQVQTDRPSYASGDPVNVTGTVSNAGVSLLQNLTVLLKVTTQAGAIVSSNVRPVPALPPGSQVAVSWAWLSAGTPPGVYRASLEVRDSNGVTVLCSAPSTFSISGGAISLTGTVALAPTVLEPSQTLAAHATVHNGGGLGLAGVELKLEVIDPLSHTVLAEYKTTADLAAGTTYTLDHPFSASSFKRQPYSVAWSASGSADGQAFQRDLASATFVVEDLTAPQVMLLSPPPGLACDQVLVRVQAIDAFTGVLRAFYRIDQGSEDIPLAPDAPPNPLSAYGATWVIPGGQEGVHRIAIFAEDMAGNVSGAVEVDLSADVNPPLLNVEAPAEGACLTQGTIVTFSAADLHLDSVTATLNGEPFHSGDPVSLEGLYTLIVTARDQCGHSTTVSRLFTIDAGGCGGTTRNTPDGRQPGAQPMRASKNDLGGSTLHLIWDAVNCPSSDYHLLWGYGSGLPAYVVEGPAACDLGASGASDWEGAPDPSGDAGRFLWFIVVGDDNSGTEGGWGYQFIGETYLDRRTGASSGMCGCTSINTDVCGTTGKELDKSTHPPAGAGNGR